MAIDESALRALEDEFLNSVERHTPVDLEAYRSTIVRFHLQGHSRALTYEFLKSRALIQCSRASFYRWVATHLDLDGHAQSQSLKSPKLEKPIETNSSHQLNQCINNHHIDAADVASVPHQSKDELKKETLYSTLFLESAKSGRSSQVAALDAVLDEIQANDMTSVASRALERLELRTDSDKDSG